MNGRNALRDFDSYQDGALPKGICRERTAFIPRSIPMMDVVMLAIGFVFFAVSIAYVYACDRL
jgi:hypothetical protein